MRKSPVIAILCSDLHLSEKPPVARSAEPDWWAAMLRPIKQLKAAQDKYNAPILCAGDVFDKWKSSPELINFALEHLPEMYAIPGQHDLPLHNYEDIDKSAFGTLVRAGKLHLLTPGKATHIGDPELGRCFIAVGFPWGAPIQSHERKRHLESYLHIAVVHAYIWTKGTGFPGAPEEKSLAGYAEALDGYDVALFGDNHKPFLARSGKCRVFNHGGFMCRKSDEMNHQPAIGLLRACGEIDLHDLDVSADRWIPRDGAKQAE